MKESEESILVASKQREERSLQSMIFPVTLPRLAGGLAAAVAVVPVVIFGMSRWTGLQGIRIGIVIVGFVVMSLLSVVAIRLSTHRYPFRLASQAINVAGRELPYADIAKISVNSIRGSCTLRTRQGRKHSVVFGKRDYETAVAELRRLAAKHGIEFVQVR